MEAHPGQNGHLSEEEQDAYSGGEDPGHFYVAVHAVVGRLADGGDVVHVADGLHVGQDTGTDHEGEEVDGHNQGGAHTEGDE